MLNLRSKVKDWGKLRPIAASVLRTTDDAHLLQIGFDARWIPKSVSNVEYTNIKVWDDEEEKWVRDEIASLIEVREGWVRLNWGLKPDMLMDNSKGKRRRDRVRMPSDHDDDDYHPSDKKNYRRRDDDE